MRFRQKLSIMLVVLVLVPLAAAAVLVSSLLARNETSRVDGRLTAAIAGGSAAYRAELSDTAARAHELALSPAIQRALQGKGKPAQALRQIESPLVGQLRVDGRTVAGHPPSGAAWGVVVPVGKKGTDQLVVWLPIDQNLVAQLSGAFPRPQGVDLVLAARGRVLAGDSGQQGAVSGIGSGQGSNATIGGTGYRVQAVGVQSTRGGPVALVATYPQSALSNAIDSHRLRVLLPMLVLGLLVALLAVFAAASLSRALTDLSARARTLMRSGEESPASGDELTELGVAIEHMSTELSTRVGELKAERERVKETLQRYGETLAATHDLDALVGAVLDTAVQATRARGGRLLLYDPESGLATEQARIGTALGSRTDLPMVVSAGAGLEGLALAEMAPRKADEPRAVLAAPVVREDELLGLVTVVDPEDGTFQPDDVETLAGLALQAGVAIENARLHRVVEQQAVTDPLTGLANRRQFWEVLAREYERAQRFDHQLGLIMLDIDDFKQINDTRGHLAGDAVLHTIAQTVQGLIREIDVAARYGGEEFAVLLPQTGCEGAANLAERLRAAIAERQITFAGSAIAGITASFGVSAGPVDGATQLDLVATADSALYEAKRHGKNRVQRACGTHLAEPAAEPRVSQAPP